MVTSLYVFLIDENRADCDMVARQLCQEFPAARVAQITSAQELEWALADGVPDLVISDYDLSWSNGLAVLRAIKAHQFACPTILFTQTISQEIAAQAIQAGLDGYIPKSPQNVACLVVTAWSALVKAHQSQAIRETETRYRNLAEGVPVGLYRTTPSGNILSANPALMRLLGYPDMVSLLKMNVTESFVDPPERSRWRTLVEHKGAVSGFQVSIRRRDGNVVWVEDNGRAIRDARGIVQYYEGSLIDITERMQAEQALRESEEQFRSVVETASDAIISTDSQGEVISWNRAAEVIFGYSSDEIIGYPLTRVLAARFRQTFRDALQQVIATGEASVSQSFDTLGLKKDGSEFPAALSFATWQVKGKTFFTSIVRDVTDQARAEQEIKLRNQELVILNEIGQAITSSLDLQETLTLITDHTTHLLNVAATSIFLCDQDNKFLHFVAGSSRDASMVVGKPLPMGEGIAGWVAQHGESALVTDTSQDPRWFGGFDDESRFQARSILCVPLQIQEQVIGVLQAINKKKYDFDQVDLRFLRALAAPAATAIEHARLFKQVQAAREQLQALSHRLVQVQETERRNISREIHDESGQVLSALLLGLSLLEGEAERPQAVLARAADLAAMVDEMLKSLHRLAVNLRPASLDHLGLAAALEQYLETFREGFGLQQGIAVRLQIVGMEDERLPPALETAFYRIVQESLTNVARHAQASQVDIHLERSGDQARITIQDDGVGFDPQEVRQSGRLGLFGMHERADMLGGTLRIESAVGAGTTIIVEAPCGAGDEMVILRF